jgi:hypothetical protein
VLNRIYLTLGIALLACYAVVAFTGWEFGSPQQKALPASVRDRPGGYRFFHFWHSGYRGGK